MSNYIDRYISQDLSDIEFVKEYGSELAKLSFSHTLSNARKSVNLSQKELADKIGHSQPYIAKLEKGDANPTISVVGSILAVIGKQLETDYSSLIPDSHCINAIGITASFTMPSSRLDAVNWISVDNDIPIQVENAQNIFPYVSVGVE